MCSALPLLILGLLVGEDAERARPEHERAAGFAAWGAAVPPEWDKVAIPEGWKRVGYEQDPWRTIGAVNTDLPELAENLPQVLARTPRAW